MTLLSFITLIFLQSLFKARVCYFNQIFIFPPNDSHLKNYECFLFHLKSSFHSRDTQIFVIFSLSTLSRFKRTNESGIIYDVMN